MPWMAPKKRQLVGSSSGRFFISATPRAYHRIVSLQSLPSSHALRRILVTSAPPPSCAPGTGLDSLLIHPSKHSTAANTSRSSLIGHYRGKLGRLREIVSQVSGPYRLLFFG